MITQLAYLPTLSPMIPTWSSNPTVYLPRLFPLWAPDKALNPITTAHIFYFPSFTSIQCAVNPRNNIFIVSANHISCITDTIPGATSSGKNKYVLALAEWNGLPLYLLFAPSFVWRTCCGYILWHHRNSGGLMWWLWAAWKRACFKMPSYQQGQEATGTFWVRLSHWQYGMKLTWFFVATRAATVWRTPALMNLEGPITLEVQHLLLLLICLPPPLLQYFFLFHDLPDLLWDHPVTDRYVFFFALLFVDLIMLTNM